MGSLDIQTQWHPQPKFHLKAPRGWINDPCAPGYDPETGTYHVFYQWNPASCDWGNICWGQFISKDGVNWQHNRDSPVLEPSLSYDKEGVFTGCMYHTGPRGEKGQLTLIYSSIQHLPIHWTIPYTRNCAGLSLATSNDGGRIWQKSTLNPILKGEPENLLVTGFRDPYLARWEAMDDLRREKSLYGVVSGGVVGEGPNAFVYAVEPANLAKWTYLGPLCDIPVAFQRPSHWNGDLGVNWECVNFMTLHNGADKVEFLLMGTEGGHRRHVGDSDDPHGVWALWLAGHLEQTESGPRMVHECSGVLDNGSFYAANSYQHPETSERIVWGWIKEEELILARRESKGWTGFLSLPREVFLMIKRNVTRALRTRLHDIPSLKVIESEKGASVVQTLGVRPLPSHAKLRMSKPMVWNRVASYGVTGKLMSVSSTSWELEAIIRVHDGQQRVGFHIHHNEDMSQRTSLWFSPQREEISVDTSHSNNEVDIKKDRTNGPFTLFICEENGVEVAEKLHLRIFVDGDVLEIFANDRFALSTVAYADTRNCTGVSWYLEGGPVDEAVFESISLWEQLGSVQQNEPHHRL